MTIIKGKSFGKVYDKAVKKLLKQDIVAGTKELNNAILVIKKPSMKVLLKKRKLSKTYMNEELKWYWSADNRCSVIGKHAKMWLRLSDDGKTNNSAYGYILFKKYGFNQLQQIIDLLKKDKYSRRAVLNISDPTIDRINTKDMQCTIAIQFLIRKHQLDMTVYMRSNDIYFGLPYDYFFFESIHQYLAKELNLPVGQYIHHATSLHMYERDIDTFKTCKNKEEVECFYQKIIFENYLHFN